MRSAERVDRKAGPGVAAPEQAAPVSSGVGSVLALQRKAGNRATTAMLSGIQRKVAKETDPAKGGPKVEIADFAGTGDKKAAADAAVAAIKAGTGNPWAQPSWKWGAPHGNFEGNLPGKPKAGSYKEYYLATTAPAKGKAFDGKGRIVTGGGQIYHTATHYGQGGATPAFTHYGAL